MPKIPDSCLNILLHITSFNLTISVQPHCKNARRDRCQEYHNCFPFRELEETTRTSSNQMDEDYLTISHWMRR